jgi:hypothetical protein
MALSLPVVLAGAALVGRPWPPGALATGPGGAHACGAESAVAVEAAAWYRIEPVLDTGGTLVARQLTVGRGAARWSATMAAESFASGPVGGRVLVGEDDGRASRLRLLDTASGCWTALGTVTDVVRSGIIGLDGTAVFEHRVERSSRRDLGVWRRDLGAAARAARAVLPGLDPDPVYGPTFSTSLVAAADGRLLVSACGERACRTRVVDPAAGAVSSIGGTGPAVGLAGDALVALDACDGLPCPLVEVDMRSGTRVPIELAQGQAAVSAAAGGAAIVAGADGLRVLGLGASAPGRVVPNTTGMAPLVAASTVDSGFEAPAGRVAVAPGGRVDDPSAVRLLDPVALQLSAGEVLP